MGKVVNAAFSVPGGSSAVGDTQTKIFAMDSDNAFAGAEFSIVLGGQRYDTNLERDAPFVWKQDSQGEELWSYDFRDYLLIDEISVLTAVRTIQYSRPAWTYGHEEQMTYPVFIAMIVEGSPFHMVFILKGKTGEVFRKWPLLQYQDSESTKAMRFLPKFADSHAVLQTITNSNGMDNGWNFYYLQPDYPFLVIQMNMNDGSIFRSKPYDDLDLTNYGDFIPSAITYYDNLLYYSGFFTEGGNSKGILVIIDKWFQEGSIQVKMPPDSEYPDFFYTPERFAVNYQSSHKYLFGIGSARETETKGLVASADHVMIFIIRSKAQWGCDSRVERLRLKLWYITDDDGNTANWGYIKLLHANFNPNNDELSIRYILNQASSSDVDESDYSLISKDVSEITIKNLKTTTAFGCRNSESNFPIEYPLRAMMDMDATFGYSDQKDGWKFPKLDSYYGWHQPENVDQSWVTVTLQQDQLYSATSVTIKKRGNGRNLDQFATHFQFEFSTDQGETWQSYKNGEWIETGMTLETVHEEEINFELEPPIVGNSFKMITNKAHRYNNAIVGRFDFWLTPEGDAPVEENPLSVTYATIPSLSDCALTECSVSAAGEVTLHGGDFVMVVTNTETQQNYIMDSSTRTEVQTLTADEIVAKSVLVSNPDLRTTQGAHWAYDSIEQICRHQMVTFNDGQELSTKYSNNLRRDITYILGGETTGESSEETSSENNDTLHYSGPPVTIFGQSGMKDINLAGAFKFDTFEVIYTTEHSDWIGSCPKHPAKKVVNNSTCDQKNCELQAGNNFRTLVRNIDKNFAFYVSNLHDQESRSYSQPVYFVDTSTLNMLTMNMIKVRQGTYRIQQADWQQWFNQDEGQPFCIPRGIFFCKYSQFQASTVFQLQNFFTGEMEQKTIYQCVKEANQEEAAGDGSTDGEGSSSGEGSADGSSEETQQEEVVETEIFEGSWTNLNTNQNIQTKKATAYPYHIELEIDISQVVEKSEETKLALYTTCQYVSDYSGEKYKLTQRHVVLDYSITDPNDQVSETCTNLIINNAQTYDKCADQVANDDEASENNCLCGRYQRIFFGTEQPTLETLSQFKLANNTESDFFTCKASEFHEDEDQLVNSCYCESEGVMKILYPYEQTTVSEEVSQGEPILDNDGNPVLDEDGNETFEEITTKITTHHYETLELLSVNSDYNDESDRAFKTCTDGSKVRIELLDYRKDPVGQGDLRVSLDSELKTLALNKSENDAQVNPLTYYLRASYIDSSAVFYPLDVKIVLMAYDPGYIVELNDPEAKLEQTIAFVKGGSQDGIENINYVNLFFSAFKTDNPQRYSHVQMIPQNLPANFQVGQLGVQYMLNYMIVNTNGLKEPFYQFDVTLDVYYPGMAKEDWFEYKLTVVVVACGTEQGVFLNILDQDGVAYSEDTPVQYAMKQNTNMYPWKQNNYTSTKNYCPLTYLDFKYGERFIKNHYNEGRPVMRPDGVYPIDSIDNPIIDDEKLINHESEQIVLFTENTGILEGMTTTIGTYNDNMITRDVKIYVCGSQTIQLNQQSTLQGFTFESSTIDVLFFKKSKSSNYNFENQQVIELGDIVTVSDTTDTSGLRKNVKEFCTLVEYSIWKDNALTQPYTNNSLAFLANYGEIYNIENESMPQQFVIKTDIGKPFGFYLSGRIKNDLMISTVFVKIDFCGDEIIKRISEEPNYDVHVNGVNWLNTIKINVLDIFSNSRAISCPIESYSITQYQFNNSMLAQRTFSEMVSIVPSANSSNLAIRTQDILIDFPEKILFSMEARSKSGNNATQNFTIHTSYGIEWHIAMAKKINQPPMLLTKIEPWIVEVAFPKQEATNSTEGSDGQEIVEQKVEEPIALEQEVEEVDQTIEFQSPEFIDYNQDLMEFNFTFPEQLLNFARVIESPQNAMTKQFILSVDKASIVPENLGLYSIVLNITDNHEEPITKFFQFTLEVMEPLPQEVVEEEIVEEEIEEEQEKDTVSSFGPSFVAKQNKQEKEFEIEEFLKEQEVKKPEKKKTNTIPDPSIKIGKVTPLGQIPIEFNQEFELPPEDYDYSDTFEVAIQSSIDGSVAIGRYISNKKRMLEQDTLIDCEGGICEAANKKFTWTVTRHDEFGLEISTIFDDPDSISTSSYGQDSLSLLVKSFKLFKSSIQNKTVSAESLPISNCGSYIASMCKLMPPLLLNEDTVSTIQGGADQMGSAINTVATTNLIIAIAMGGTAQQLFGMIRLIQILLLSAIMAIVYPAHLTLFYSFCVSFAGMDVLQGATIYEATFQFKETSPPSPTFEQYEIEDLNFFMNSGSMLIIVVLIFMSYFSANIRIFFAKKFFKFRLCRKIGIKASKQNQLRMPLLKLFIEGYIDIVLSCLLSVMAIMSEDTWAGLASWFATFDDTLNSVVAIIAFLMVIFVPIYVSHILKKFRNRLNDEEVKEKYGIFYEEFRLDNRNAVYYPVIMMVRRLCLIIVLVTFVKKPWLQSQLLLAISMMNLCFMFAVRPYFDKLTNRMEIVNEITVYISAILHIQFNQESLDQKAISKFKNWLGWVVIGNVCANIIINIAVVSIQTLYTVFKNMRDIKRSTVLWLKTRQFKRANELLLREFGPELFPNIKLKMNEQEAITFCKDFATDRQWCFDNGIDYRQLEEEKIFQDHVMKYSFDKRRKDIEQELRISKQLHDQYKVERSARIQTNINKKREEKLVQYERDRVQLMINKGIRRLGTKAISRSQANMSIQIKAKEPKKSVWTKQVQDDGTQNITDVKIGTKLPSTIKNMKATQNWLANTPEPILEVIQEETVLSDDPYTPVSPNQENKRKSTTKMFNQLMLQNIKSKMVQIDESDSESSQSSEEKDKSQATTQNNSQERLVELQVKPPNAKESLFEGLRKIKEEADNKEAQTLASNAKKAKLKLDLGMKKLQQAKTKTDLAEIIPGTVVSSGMDIRRLEQLNKQLQRLNAQKNETVAEVYDKSLVKTIETHIEGMKQEREETMRQYQIRVNMLQSGKYDQEEIEPYYQEKFEFVVNHKFEGDEKEEEKEKEQEEPIDDYFYVDMQQMVWRFINKAIERMPWPKDIPRGIPEGLTFLQQPEEVVNSLQYCLMHIDQFKFKLAENGELSEWYQKLFKKEYRAFDFGRQFILKFKQDTPLKFYVRQIQQLNREQKLGDIKRLFEHTLAHDRRCMKCTTHKKVEEPNIFMSLQSNVRKLNLAPHVPNMTPEQIDNEIMTVQKLVDFKMGSYSPIDLDLEYGRQSIMHCSTCERITKHLVKSTFSGAPEILPISFKQIKQEHIKDFAEKALTFNKQFKQKLTTLEKDFLDDVELDILDQELTPHKNLLESAGFDYVEDSSSKLEIDREFKKLFQVNDKIIIDLNLNLESHLEPGEQSQYLLFAVILWDQSVYIRKEDKWFYHEEDEITQVTEQDVLENTWPYMLFYSRHH